MGIFYNKLKGENTIFKRLKEENYELIFEDDFEGDELNKKYWVSSYGKEYMRRAAYYVDDKDSVFLKDSKLVIRTSYREDGKYGPGWYTGWVESAPKGAGRMNENLPDDYEGCSAKNGYFEARLKGLAAKGMWGAFWLMPDEADGAVGMTPDDIIGTGSDGVEVDVYESLYNSKIIKPIRECLTQVIHMDGYGEYHRADKAPTYRVKNMYDEFHTYGVEWTDKEYIFYIDGEETYRTPVKNGEKIYGVAEKKAYMLLTVEVAGVIVDNKLVPGKEYGNNGKLVRHYAGNPENNDKSKCYDFEVDYVRLYQKKDNK